MVILNIIDIFNVYNVINNEEYDNKYYIDNIINNNEINWTTLLPKFYLNPFYLTEDNIIYINDNIYNILLNINNKENNNNNLQNFNRLNNIFNIINELNITYNIKNNNINYTLNKLQELYIKYILNNKEYLNHWYHGIYNITLQNIINEKSKYYKGLIILKNYLINSIDIDIKDFLINYSKYITDFLIKSYNKKLISFYEIFLKFDILEKLNNIFLENNYNNLFIEKNIIFMISYWKIFLNEEKNISKTEFKYILLYLNRFDLSKTEFNNITYNYLFIWIKNLNFNNYNYNNIYLYNKLNEVLPLITIFKEGMNYSSEIINLFQSIYDIDNNIIKYIVDILDRYIKESKLKFNIFIENCIEFLNLYKDKTILSKIYFKNLNKRLNDLLKLNKLNINIILFEEEIIKKFKNNKNDFSNILIENFKLSYEHKIAISKSNIKFIDNDNNPINLILDFDISKIFYNIIDKNILEIKNIDYNIIDYNILPDEIKAYINIGKKYYTLVNESKIIEWNIKNSIINYKFNNKTITSTILQFLIISYIKKYNNNNDLINYIINKELTNVELKNSIDYLNNIIIDLKELNLFSDTIENIDLTIF